MPAKSIIDPYVKPRPGQKSKPVASDSGDVSTNVPDLTRSGQRLPILCDFYHYKGGCYKGDACPFSHDRSAQKLQNPSPSSSSSSSTQALWTDIAKSKTRMCSYFQAGNCSRGVNCAFAHDREELAPRDSWRSVEQQVPSSNRSTGSSDDIQSRDPATLKTKLCAYHKEGRCFLGARCTYAHSTAELQSFDRVRRFPHPVKQDSSREEISSNNEDDQCSDPAVFKTQLCLFHQQGRCKRGATCTYAHDAAELQVFDTDRRYSQQESTGPPAVATLHQYMPAKFRAASSSQPVAAQARSTSPSDPNPSNGMSRPSSLSAPSPRSPRPSPQPSALHLTQTSNITTLSANDGGAIATTRAPECRQQQPTAFPVKQTAGATQMPADGKSAVVRIRQPAAPDISQHRGGTTMPAVGTNATAVTSHSLSQPSCNQIVTNQCISYEERHSDTANGVNVSRTKTRKAVWETFTEDDHLFCCPISHELFVHPVVAADGHTYELQQMQSWLSKKKTSPLTNESLKHTELLPNLTLLKVMVELGLKA